MNNEEKILKILEQMQGDISTLKEDVGALKECQNRIESKVGELEAMNADRHIEIFNVVDTTNNDVKFIKYKLRKAEEDVFDIKNKLQLVK